jgi:hypothetical protein
MRRRIALVVAALIFSSGAVLKADDIDGNIAFAGAVNLDTSSAGTATAVTAWHFVGNMGDPYVAGASGDFSGTLGMSAIFAAPWSFNSGPVSSFWTVGGFTFDLTSSAITTQGFDTHGNGYVVVNGIGVASGNGFTPTPGTWAFTTQDPSAGAVFSFSSSDAVPEPATGALIAAGTLLIGVASRSAYSRKVRASR